MLANHTWRQPIDLPSRSFTCGNCGNPIASEKGYPAKNTQTGHDDTFIYICHKCNEPTYLRNDGRQIPGNRICEDVTGIPNAEVLSLYNEARDCFSVNAFTSTVLGCRKLLMHIAVSLGDAPGKKFIEYVEWLSSNNHIPVNAKGWVDHIRTKSNEANHEIILMNKEDAKDLLEFSEMLLKVTYEFPSRISAKQKTP